MKIQQFDFSVNLMKAILWQYNEALTLQSLLEQKDKWYVTNQSEFWSNWYNDVFNIDTANNFGLDVWAIILGIPLGYNVEGSGDRLVWGFGQYAGNFSTYDGNGTDKGVNFGRDTSGTLSLNTDQKRLIIKLRYFQLISNGCVNDVNIFLKQLFGDGVYALDGLDMTYTVVFQTIPNNSTLFVLQNFNLLPRPAGVEVKILISPKASFGFDPYYLNFNNAGFASQ